MSTRNWVYEFSPDFTMSSVDIAASLDVDIAPTGLYNLRQRICLACTAATRLNEKREHKRVVLEMTSENLSSQLFTRPMNTLLTFVAGFLLFSSGLCHAQNTSLEHIYSVKGIIKKLPPSLDSRTLFIRHDPIPNYVDETGKAVGMSSMTMPFEVSRDVSLEGLNIGDSIEFTWVSRWEPKPFDQIVAIKKMSAP